jgi:glycosyltransferase involved in cell wall biosynthesis
MRILFATPLYPPQIGGPATYAKIFEEGAKKEGHEVLLVTFSSVATYPPLVRHGILFLKLLRKGMKADVIFAQDVFSVGLPAMIAAKVLRKPFMVRVPGDFAWEQSKQRFGVTDTIDVFQKKKYGFVVSFYKWAEHLVVRNASYVMTPSKYFSQLVKTWMKSGEPITVYNGIPFEKIKIYKQDKKHQEYFSIISAGRMVPWKGFRELITLLRNNPWKLTLVGDGPDRYELETYAREIGVEDRVTFLGTLNQDDLFKKIAEHSVFILNSSFESFSYQLVEAMAIGTPVVVKRGSNIEEIITDKGNGMLFASSTELEEVITVLAKNPDLQERLSLAAIERAREFDSSKTIQKVLELCISLIHKRNKIIFLSTDRTVFDQNSRTYKRLSGYGSLGDKVLFIVPTLRSMGYKKLQVGNVSFIPTNSISRAFYAWDLMIKALHERKGIKIISPQDIGFLGLIALIVSGLTRASLYVQMHNDMYSPYYGKTFKQNIEQIIGRFVLRRASKVRVVSKKIKNSITPFTKAPVSVVPIYMEITSDQIENNDGILTFFTFSRLEKEKNIEAVLRVYKKIEEQYANIKLIIAGTGSLKNDLIKLAGNLHIKNCSFIGWTTREHIFSKGDVMIQNSSHEGYGLSLVESLVAHRPVISTKTGIAEEYIINGKNGFLYNVGDMEKMEEYMVSFLKDKNLLSRMKTELKTNPIELPFKNERAYLEELKKFYE